MSDGNHIGIIVFQYSIVVKGIERKLNEYGFKIDIISNSYENIVRFGNLYDLFVLYLPIDIMEDTVNHKLVKDIAARIHKTGVKTIVLGEKKYHAELVQETPDIASFLWLDRPVDNEQLRKTIDDYIMGAVKTTERKRILIVDDDPSYASMVREWIKDSFKADIVTAGMQAITFLVKNKVDLILLDYEMPIVDGPQVLQMLRQDEATKEIPVVFLTGVGTKEGVTRVMALKPAGYILKSTTRDNLLDYLHKKLG